MASAAEGRPDPVTANLLEHSGATCAHSSWRPPTRNASSIQRCNVARGTRT